MIDFFIHLAVGLTATNYGSNSELMCGDVGSPRPCVRGEPTASGEVFKPFTISSAAVPAPFNTIIRPKVIWVRAVGFFKCIAVRINDKAHPRWIGNRGLDLSPAAVFQLTGKWPSRFWSGKIEKCEEPTHNFLLIPKDSLTKCRIYN